MDFFDRIGIDMTKNQRLKIRWIVDLLMTVGLFFVSGYQFWTEESHEWVGVGMFFLFLVHHFLNLAWYKNLWKGKYSFARILKLLIDFALLAMMLAQMYSGILLSRYIFDFLPLDGGLFLARKLHILGAYWGFLLMSLHIGFHWDMMIQAAKRKFPCQKESNVRSMICFLLSAGIAVYGGIVFVKRDFPIYLFLQSEFVFLDYGEPIFAFYGDYLALMGTCIFIVHYLLKIIRNAKKS